MLPVSITILPKKPFIVDTLRDKVGLNAHYLPEGFNPRIHQKPQLDKAVAEELTNIDVLMYGSMYPYRARMVEQLLRAGVRVYVYGTEGPYLRPAVRAAFRKQFLAGAEKKPVAVRGQNCFEHLALCRNYVCQPEIL